MILPTTSSPTYNGARTNYHRTTLSSLIRLSRCTKSIYPAAIPYLPFMGHHFHSLILFRQQPLPNYWNVYFENQKADIFIGGHSHIQMVRRYDDKLILNTGSIGNAFKFVFSPGNPVDLLPWAEYMIINQSGNSLNINSRRVYFDTDELLKKVKESHLPSTDWWLKQYSK